MKQLNIIYKENRTVIIAVLSFMSAVCTLMSFRCQNVNNRFYFPFDFWGLESTFAIGLMTCLYFFIIRKGMNFRILILAVLLAVFTLIGFCYANSFSGIMALVNGKKQLVKSCFYFYGYGILYYIGLLTLNDLITKINEPNAENHSNINERSKKVLIRYAIPLIALWMIYLIIQWPGTLSFDSGQMLKEIVGIEPLEANNPVFQIFFIGAFFRLGVLLGNANIGLFLYCMVQIIALAFCVSYSFLLLRQLGISGRIGKLLYGLYIINPVVAWYVIFIGKDTNFGICVFWFLNLSLDLYLNAEKCLHSKRFFASVFIDCILTGLFRNAGIWLIIAYLAVFIIVIGKRRKQIKLWHISILAMAFALLFVWKSVLPAVLNIERQSPLQDSSIAMQQVGRYVTVYKNELTDEELTLLNNVFDVDKISETYDPEIADGVWQSIKQPISKEEWCSFQQVHKLFFIKHKTVYIDAMLNKSYGYLYPDCVGRSKGYVFNGLSNVAHINDSGDYDLSSAFPRCVSFVSSFQAFLRKVPIVSLFTSCGFYAWVLVICSYFTLFIGRNATLGGLFLPSYFLLLGAMASPCNAYFRYITALVFMMPVFIGICIGSNRKE